MRIKLLLTLTLAVALCGCKIQQGTTTLKTDTIIVKQIDTRVDSVYIDRWHNIITRGDTIFKLDSVVEYRWRDRLLLDTIFESKTDSVLVERVQEVRRRSAYDKFVSVGFWSLAALVAAFVAWRIYRAFYRRR